MSDFYNLFKNTVNRNDSNKILSQNGAVEYASAGDNLVDFAYSTNSLRNKSEYEIACKFEHCYIDNPKLAVKLLFQMGDCRGGKGERRIFNICLRYMALEHPAILKELLPLVPEYTRWDHVAWMATCGNKESEKIAVKLIREQLAKDYEAAKVWHENQKKVDELKFRHEHGMLSDEEYKLALMELKHVNVSLCAKWLPQPWVKDDNKKRLRYAIADYEERDENNGDIIIPRWNMADMRKTLSYIREPLNLTESILSQKKEITPEILARMTSIQQLKLAEALRRNGGEAYDAFIEKVENGELKINTSVLTPADVVYRYRQASSSRGYGRGLKHKDKMLELLWKNLPGIESGEKKFSVIVVRDDSGSMMTPAGKNSKMNCLDVATAFSIYCAEQLEGPYKDKFISFSRNPKYLDVSNFDNLHDKLRYAYSHSEVSNTDIAKTFNLLLKTAVDNNLKQEEVPNCVLIFSDMEFDDYWAAGADAKNKALFDSIREEWTRAGYEMPVCAFWNLNPARAVIPDINEGGVILLSGYTKNNLDLLMSGALMDFSVPEKPKALSPEEQLMAALSKKRYDAVDKAFDIGRASEDKRSDMAANIGEEYPERLPLEDYFEGAPDNESVRYALYVSLNKRHDGNIGDDDGKTEGDDDGYPYDEYDDDDYKF